MDAVAIITDLGFPIAAALGLGMFVWKLINRIIDGMENKLDTLDNKVQKKFRCNGRKSFNKTRLSIWHYSKLD
jgi:hypothetical protein